MSTVKIMIRPNKMSGRILLQTVFAKVNRTGLICWLFKGKEILRSLFLMKWPRGDYLEIKPCSKQWQYVHARIQGSWKLFWVINVLQRALRISLKRQLDPAGESVPVFLSKHKTTCEFPGGCEFQGKSGLLPPPPPLWIRPSLLKMWILQGKGKLFGTCSIRGRNPCWTRKTWNCTKEYRLGCTGCCTRYPQPMFLMRLRKIIFKYALLSVQLVQRCIIIGLYRGSYKGAHVLLNLLNELGKRDNMWGLPSILSRFRNEFNEFNNISARMLDSIYHMTNTLKSHFWRKNVIILSLCTGRHKVCHKSINH